MESSIDYLTVKEVSEVLGITESAVRERIRSKKLPAIKAGREYRVAASSLLESAGISKALAVYLCQFLARSLAEESAKIFAERARAIIRERLDASLAREAEANRLYGEARAEADFNRQWAVRMQKELDAYKFIHALRVMPGMVLKVEAGGILEAGEDAAGGPPPTTNQ